MLILGAGISGLAAAYELSRKGYDVQVIEASHRAGGRNLTLRGGDLVDEAEYPQRCEFDRDPELYFNAGPARIPGHHTTLLGYCKELGVPLAPFVNENRNAWVQDDAMFGGRPVRNREYIADSRGFVAELLAKTVRPESFGTAFDNRDYQQLLEYLRQFGELDGRFKYVSSSRAGYATHDYTSPPAFKQPLNASELLRSGFVYLMSFSELDDQSAMMMEPVGGMDRIVTAFMSKMGHLVKLSAPVESDSPRRFRCRCSLSPRRTHRRRARGFLLDVYSHAFAGASRAQFPQAVRRRRSALCLTASCSRSGCK